MKRLYVCGSYRFEREMDNLARKLGERNVAYEISKKNNRGILGCLRKIDDSDMVYIVNPEGYVGRSVSVDIGYAYAKNKPIYAMCPVTDPPVAGLISEIVTPDALIDLIKSDQPNGKR